MYSEERMITMTNSERRDKGLLYITDETVLAEQVPARRLTQKLNTMDRADFEGITAVIKELFAECEDAFVNPPFYCDYGHHISVGKCFYANYGCTMLDAGFIRIGDYCKFGPNVSIYAAGHPLDVKDRIAGNTAGVLMKNSVHKEFVQKHGEVNMANVLQAAIDGEIVFAYTNPYTSSTGLNILSSMLYAFDNNNPLSDTAVNKLIEYQRNAPTAAYTTAVLKNSAAKGIIDVMVMEEQAYMNTKELTDNYTYTPAGIRHDHPVAGHLHHLHQRTPRNRRRPRLTGGVHRMKARKDALIGGQTRHRPRHTAIRHCSTVD